MSNLFDDFDLDIQKTMGHYEGRTVSPGALCGSQLNCVTQLTGCANSCPNTCAHTCVGASCVNTCGASCRPCATGVTCNDPLVIQL